jgi:hypothetical protein
MRKSLLPILFFTLVLSSVARTETKNATQQTYAKNPHPRLNILIHVGTKGFNYQNNLEYMKLLDSLKIPYQRLIVKDAPHSAKTIYQKQGEQIMKFHAANFR